MKKKMITLLLATSMIASITSCGNTKKEAKESTGSESIATESASNTETKETSTDATTTTETTDGNTTPSVVSSDDPTIFDTDESVITLREYLDSNVTNYQTADNIGSQNGAVFKERGYDEDNNIVYELCGIYYGGIDVMFTDSHDNIILIDYMADGFEISLDRVELHMNDDCINYITYDGNDRVYSFAYDEDGNLTQYGHESLVFSKEISSSQSTTILAYPVGSNPDDYTSSWKYNEQGDISNILTINGTSGILYKYETEVGNDNFHYVSSLEIKDCVSGEVETITY